MNEFRENANIHIAQPPYNLFERTIEHDIKPYCERNDITTITYGALCRGLLSGKVTTGREFKNDDLRKSDPKFQKKNRIHYLEAVRKLDDFAGKRFNRSVLQLSIRWILDMGAESAIWGARSPEQLELEGIFDWKLTDEDKAIIDRILTESISHPIGPGFMAPPG